MNIFLNRLVDTTINSAVKEHLFGPGVTVSSTDSDLQEDLSATVSSRRQILLLILNKFKRINFSSPMKISENQRFSDNFRGIEVN